MSSSSCRTVIHGRHVGWLLVAALLCSAGMARATVHSYFIAGHAVNFSFDPVSSGTPFAGTYQFDDAATDTDLSTSVGTYATGQFFVDLGPALGTITLDQSGSTGVLDNSTPVFATKADIFRISAGVGARDTPGFSNAIVGPGQLSFQATTLGFPPPDPTALTSDSLVDTVPLQVVGAPWDASGQNIVFVVANSPPNCHDALTTQCFITLRIETIGTPFTLTVVKTGTGSGVVTSDIPGIDCGATCAADLLGTVVLTATPDPGSFFSGWLGCDSEVGNQCTVDVEAARTVTAAFEIVHVPTVSAAGLVLLATLLALAALVLLGALRSR